MADKSVSVLDSIYNQTLIGLPGSGSVQELAEDFLSESGSLDEKVDSLIRYQIAKCSATGFLTGVGGLLTLPITIPADIGVNLYVQMRMVAAIAHMGGYNLNHDKVRTFIYVALCGNSAKEVLKDAGIQFANKFGMNVIQKKVTSEIIKEINRIVGFQLITKAGSKGVINLTKMVPILGGVVGATFDGYATNVIGDTAKEMFIKP